LVNEILTALDNSSIAIDFVERGNGQNTSLLAYIYLDYRNQSQQTPIHIITTFLRQLMSCHGSLFPAASGLFDRYKSGQSLPSPTELVGVLLKLCSTETNIYIIVDALDECDPKQTLPYLLTLLGQISSTQTKLFVTSRPFSGRINSAFLGCQQLKIEAGESDLRLFLDTKVKMAEHLPCLLHDDLRGKIVTAILQKAKGM
jgi:hypothetical protein